MTRIKSSLKRIKITQRNKIANRLYMSTLKTAIKKCLSAMRRFSIENMSNIESSINIAYSKIDKAVKRKVIHKNNAARKKQRIIRIFHKKKQDLLLSN
uniref:ribosomal protein S20 n=1 Tax=Galdieria phlegrea TaxID=1389228 RepID=UPI0023D7D622|nr:ribosomal protein S20 [Galdieria phlegrea]UNJ16179.1 ribosomal protein S20 [Galdieria sp.]WDA99579.1 ribosomal protein S20 [Galdieria sulphuraria]WDA99769.1 ribosomal protein S20 [Galdieria phlegrea]